MCDCIKKVNASLAEHNGQLAFGFVINEGMGLKQRILISTEKLDKAKRKPVPYVTASHCPFCGSRFDADVSQTQAPAPAVPSGWKLVPVEPTREIIEAICHAKNHTRLGIHAVMTDVELSSIYRAALTAAPTPHATPAQPAAPGDVAQVIPLNQCAADGDGDCEHAQCPQLRDGEPHASGRHCPLDTAARDERELLDYLDQAIGDASDGCGQPVGNDDEEA